MPTHRIQFIPPLELVGLRARGAYSDAAARAWPALFEWLDRRKLHDPRGRGYGILNDDPRKVQAADLRYDACICKPQTWQTEDEQWVGTFRLEGGAYALHQVTGDYKRAGDSIAELRDTWIPGNNLQIDSERPLMVNFLDDPRVVAAESQRADLCIPVKAHRRTLIRRGH